MTDADQGGSPFAPPQWEVPRVVARLGRLSTTRGDAEVFQTNDPFPGRKLFCAYVALVGGEPVMFVTFREGNDGISRHVHVVWAHPDMRYRSELDGRESVPVQIGRWLFAKEYLTHHSADRTPSGDRWAGQVDGEIPPILAEDDPKRGDPEATERSSRRAYKLLCQVEWEAVPPGSEEASQWPPKGGPTSLPRSP